MQRLINTNDNQRLAHLKTILAHPDLINAQGQRLLGQEQIEETRTLTERLESAIAMRDTNRTAQREALSKRDDQRERIIRLIRASWNNLKNKIRAGIIDENAYTRFGLGMRGKRPDPTTTRGWLNAASPLTEESEIEVTVIDKAAFQTEMEQALSLEIEVEATTARLRESQVDLKRIREQTDEHLRGTALAIKAVLYGSPPVDQRNTMRIMGYRFKDDPTTQTEITTSTET